MYLNIKTLILQIVRGTISHLMKLYFLNQLET